MKWLILPLVHDWPTTCNWILKQILGTFKILNMLLKGVNCSFQKHLRTSKMGENGSIYKVISFPSLFASFLKNPQFNPEANTGHIEMIKHAPKRYDSQLSDAPKNIENREELVNLQSDWFPPSFCIISKNLAIKSWRKYWAHSDDQTCS